MTRGPRRGRRRLLGLLAGPILVGSCAPTQCAPAPPAPPPATARPTTTTSTTTTTTTTAPPAAGQWAFLVTLEGGAYTRWDPCKGPITYRIDRTLAPRALDVEVMREALAAAAAATGFTFQEVASGEEVVLSLKDFTAEGYPPGMLGEGGGDYDRTTGEMLSGIVRVAPGLERATLRYALLHEIGHMLGLGHVTSKLELMYQYAVSPPKQEYAAGDREGLRRVGATMKCFPSQQLRMAPPIERIIVS
jgi:hypothetical protein